MQLLTPIHQLRAFLDQAQVVLENWEYLAEFTRYGVVDLSLDDGTDLRINPCLGLCNWTRPTIDSDLDVLFEAWPYFSGDTLYPVGGEDEYYNTQNMYTNPHRKALLEHMVSTVTTYLGEQ